MAKSHFARRHLKNELKIIAGGTLWGTYSHRGISWGAPGNSPRIHPHPRGTLGEHIPGKPRGTVRVPKSQISIKISNLNSKMYENQHFLARFAISLLDIISTLAFCTCVFRKRFVFVYKTQVKLH